MAKNRSETSAVFGIHVGNTSACLASYKDGKLQVIANDAGDRITPAVVAVKGAERLVGSSAKAEMMRNRTSTIVCNKRLLNDNLDQETLSNIEVKAPFKITREGNVVKYELTHDEKVYNMTAESVTVAIFSKLHEMASSSGSSESDLRAVICCPLNFPQCSRCTLMHAAEEAGFDVLQVISEPSATALAYGVGIENPEEDLMCLVYRVGGATLDVSIVEVHSGMYSIRQSVHLPDLGGDRFTTLLTEYLSEEYKKKYKLDPSESRRSMAKLTSAAENCKHILSALGTAHCFVESLCEGVDFSYHISRARFESLITSIIPKYVDPIKEALQRANIENRRIQKVLLSGGSVKIPKLLQILKDLFPQAEFVDSLSPDEVIAIGAARQASYVSSINNPEWTQQLSHEIPAVAAPILVKGSLIEGMECIIRGNIPVPVSVKKKFSVEPNKEIYFELLELDPETSTVRGSLGKLNLSPVPSQTDLTLEVGVNSGGALNAVLSHSSGEKKTTLKLDPPAD